MAGAQGFPRLEAKRELSFADILASFYPERAGWSKGVPLRFAGRSLFESEILPAML
jgi:hypothetical protein